MPDVASGKGTTAIFLAERFECEVTGIDYGSQNIEHATNEVSSKGLGHRVRFQRGDAESLPFADGTSDAIFCECAFGTFPDKSLACREFARVLRPGGRAGLSDLTRRAALPKDLDSLLAWVSCIADAQPIERYTHYLRSAGLLIQAVESHDGALREMVRQVQGKLLAVEIMTALKKIELRGFDLAAATQMAGGAFSTIERGQLGYAIITPEKQM